MKFKPGDRVRIRSYQWYLDNRDEKGKIIIDDESCNCFCPSNIEMCGKVFIINRVYKNGRYCINSLIEWGLNGLTDDMLEPEPVLFEYCIEVNGRLDETIYYTEEEAIIALDVWKKCRPMDEVRVRTINL